MVSRLTNFATREQETRARFVLVRLVCLLLVQQLFPATLLAADLSIQSYVDRSTLRVGKQFTLSVDLSGADSDKVANPQPPALDAFARYVGGGTSTSVEVVNGRMSSRRTLSFYYQASEEGKFQIPQISISFEGKDYRTQPINIEIILGQGNLSPPAAPSSRTPLGRVPASQNGITSEDLFVRASVNKTRVYQNETIILTYKIYTRVNVSRYGIAKAPDRSGFWVEDLQGEKRPLQTSTEVIDDRRYTVTTIQRLALFSASPGKKTIEPLELECEVPLLTTRRRFLDDFFNARFGRSARYQINSEPVEIEVLPLPEAGKPDHFSAAVGNFAFTGRIDKSDVATNEVVTLTLELEGSGNFRTISNPTVKFPPGLEAYDPEITESIGPAGSGFGGTRKYEYVMVPRTAGTHRIEPVQFTYFDPALERYRTATVEEIVIHAEKSSSLVHMDAVIGSKQDVRLLAQEIRFIKLDPGDFSVTDFSAYRSMGFWLILLLPVGGVGISFLVRRRLDRLEGDLAYARGRRAGKLARNRLARTRTLLDESTQKEFYAECGRALRGFAADTLNISEAGMMSEDLRKLLSQEDVSKNVIQEYVDCLELGDMKHFAPVGSTPHEMSEFLSRAELAITSLHKELS